MFEHRLSWYSNDSSGETFSLESEAVGPDRFWDRWQKAVEANFEVVEGGSADVRALTREQFRKVIKFLVDTGDFRMGATREVANHEFRTGKGWVEKAV